MGASISPLSKVGLSSLIQGVNRSRRARGPGEMTQMGEGAERESGAHKGKYLDFTMWPGTNATSGKWSLFWTFAYLLDFRRFQSSLHNEMQSFMGFQLVFKDQKWPATSCMIYFSLHLHLSSFSTRLSMLQSWVQSLVKSFP